MVNANTVPKIEQISRLLKVCRSEKETLIVESLFYCAIRNKELVLLKVGDFDFDLNKVYIRKETAKYESKGFVPLNPIHTCHVRDYIFQQKLTNEDYLFTHSHDKKPYTTRRIRAIVTAIAKRADLNSIYPHMLRHARARWLLYNGYSMDYTKRFLRHKKISTTIDVYGEYDDEEFMKKAKEGVQPILLV
jgi:integrase